MSAVQRRSKKTVTVFKHEKPSNETLFRTCGGEDEGCWMHQKNSVQNNTAHTLENRRYMLLVYLLHTLSSKRVIMQTTPSTVSHSLVWWISFDRLIHISTNVDPAAFTPRMSFICRQVLSLLTVDAFPITPPKYPNDLFSYFKQA